MFGYAVFIVTMLVMKLAPQSSLGRWLNATLVERPLTKIAGMDRRQVILVMILIGITLFATDMVMMFGSYDLLTLYAWDLTVYLDTMMVAYALAAAARGRAAVRWLVLRGSLLSCRGVRPRARRTRAAAATPHDRDNDDEPAPTWSLAA